MIKLREVKLDKGVSKISNEVIKNLYILAENIKVVTDGRLTLYHTQETPFDITARLMVALPDGFGGIINVKLFKVNPYKKRINVDGKNIQFTLTDLKEKMDKVFQKKEVLEFLKDADDNAKAYLKKEDGNEKNSDIVN